MHEKGLRSVVCDHLRVRSLPKELEPMLANCGGNPYRALNLAQKLVAEGLIQMKDNKKCLARALKSSSFNRILFCEM